MKTVVIVETDKKIQSLIVEKFKKIGDDYDFIFCDSMNDAKKIESIENLYFFVNKSLQEYAKLSSPYTIIYDISELDRIDEYVLYVYENLKTLDEIFSNISEYTSIFDRLVLFDTKDHILIPWSEIVYIERVKRYSLVKTSDEKIYSTRQSFDQLFPQLGSDFVQTHKSYIVNLKHVKNYKKTDFVLDSGALIPISRGCVKSVSKVWERFKEIHNIQ